MQAPELAIKELERCVKELGLAGIEIGSHVNDWNLNDPNLFPIFQAAEELGAVIFVHSWDMIGKERMPKYRLPWLVGMSAEVSLAICSMIFGGVFERLPKLRVAFAHGGGAVASWSKTLAGELAPFGITVNNVLPGMTKTGRLDSLIKSKSEKSGKSVDEITREMIAEIPAGRFAMPEEFAAAVAFLASPAASYINGINLPVDGGRTLSL